MRRPGPLRPLRLLCCGHAVAVAVLCYARELAARVTGSKSHGSVVIGLRTGSKSHHIMIGSVVIGRVRAGSKSHGSVVIGKMVMSITRSNGSVVIGSRMAVGIRMVGNISVEA